MRFVGAVVLFLLCISSVRAELSIADLTPCGLGCLVVTIPEAGCSLTDAACQCNSMALAQASSLCLLQNCTMHDSLVVSKVQASICRLPSENQSNKVIAATSAIAALATVFVILRFIAKGWSSNRSGKDDWIIALALILIVPIMYFTITMSNEGFGKHVWDLQDGDLLKILRSFYIAENIYVVVLGLVKLSVLVFYLEIFPQTWFRYLTFAAIVFVSISTTVLTFLTIFQCKPVAYFWNRDLRGTCININALAYANSAMSIVQDVLIVALPIPVLSKLQLGRRKKIGVIFMFAVGSFGCIVSMIRLRSLLVFGNSIDPTWDYMMAVIWTGVELAVAMICVCFPAIRRLLVRLYPTAFASSNQHTNDYQLPSSSWYKPASQQQKVAENGQFVELRHIATPESLVPPKVPPKDPPAVTSRVDRRRADQPIKPVTWFDSDST